MKCKNCKNCGHMLNVGNQHFWEHFWEIGVKDKVMCNVYNNEQTKPCGCTNPELSEVIKNE